MLVSIKISSENTERFSLRELLSIDFVSGTRLLVFKFEIYITGLLIVLFLSHIGTTSVLLELKNFILNLSKSTSWEILIKGIVLAR